MGEKGYLVLDKVQIWAIRGRPISQGVDNVMSPTLVPQEILEWYLSLEGSLTY